MQWVRAACVRPAPSMRVCARSYLGRASIAKTVVDILQQLHFKCLSVTHCHTTVVRLALGLPVAAHAHGDQFG